MWSFNGINIIVEKDSQDSPTARIGVLDVLGSTEPLIHFGGLEQYHRELQLVMYDGYDTLLAPLIDSGYYTLISDQGNEGRYAILSARPQQLQALNYDTVVHRVTLNLLKSISSVWPTKVYVGTTLEGVYYSDNFTGPGGSMSTWTEVRDLYGGGTIKRIKVLRVDRSNPTYRQYAQTLYSPTRTIFRREIDVESGQWVKILDTTIARTYQAAIDRVIDFDVDYDGTIYAYCRDMDYSSTPIQMSWILKSVDTGDNWTVLTPPFTVRTYRKSGEITVDHGYIYYWYDEPVMGYPAQPERVGIIYSTDGGSTWHDSGDLGNNTYWYNSVALNYGDPSYAYTKCDTGGADLGRLDADIQSYAEVQTGLGEDLLGSKMWSSLRDYNYMRLIKDNKLYTTHDNWATVDNQDPSAITQIVEAECIAPFVDTDDEELMIIGSTSPTESEPHVVGTLQGDDDTVFQGRAGSNAATSPYTNSIPRVCGGICQNGIQVVG